MTPRDLDSLTDVPLSVHSAAFGRNQKWSHDIEMAHTRMHAWNHSVMVACFSAQILIKPGLANSCSLYKIFKVSSMDQSAPGRSRPLGTAQLRTSPPAPTPQRNLSAKGLFTSVWRCEKPSLLVIQNTAPGVAHRGPPSSRITPRTDRVIGRFDEARQCHRLVLYYVCDDPLGLAAMVYLKEQRTVFATGLQFTQPFVIASS